MDHPRGVRSHYGKIQISWTYRGKRYYETLDLAPNATNIGQAVRIRKSRIDAMRFGLPTANEGQTFEETAQSYLNSTDVELSTRNSYRDSLNIYWQGLGPRDICSITTAELIALDDSIDWPSRKTRANALIPLRQVFRFALARGYIMSNPAYGLRSRRSRQSDSPDPYSAEERDKILAWLKVNGISPSYEYFTLAFHTGARTSELIALQWKDYDGKSLFIERAYVRRKMKGTKTASARRVILTEQAIRVLNSMPRPIHGGEIFRNQYGRPFQSAYHLNKSFRRAHKATRIRHRSGPYPWRHTYASLGLTAGVKPAFLAKQLGHSLTVLLKTYARWIDDEGDHAELAKLQQTRTSPEASLQT